MRIIHYAKLLLQETEFSNLLNQQFLKDIMCLTIHGANYLLSAINYHFQISINYDIERKIRNDKYYFLLSTNPIVIKTSDIVSILYKSVSYITVKERVFLLLIKQSD